MGNEKFLVTGAFGCIGAWVLKCLADEGVPTVATDLASNDQRARLLLDPDQLSRLEFHALDVADRNSVFKVISGTEATHIIHLAGLQVPFCKADPAMGARVNVSGTINIFDAAVEYRGQVRGLSYASSVAVFGPPSRYSSSPLGDDASHFPNTLYGVYKVANEQAARVYWNDQGLGSVGLRPYIVYGVARDQGLTSDIAKSILAAAAGRPYRIKFGGLVALQYAEDVARMFIQAARSGFQGAAACNLRNDVMDVGEFVEQLKQVIPGARVEHNSDAPLPFPADLDDSGLKQILGGIPHTPLAAAVRDTASRFEELLSRGMITTEQL